MSTMACVGSVGNEKSCHLLLVAIINSNIENGVKEYQLDSIEEWHASPQLYLELRRAGVDVDSNRVHIRIRVLGVAGYGPENRVLPLNRVRACPAHAKIIIYILLNIELLEHLFSL
jgi:hypothetical protein